jgi:outer membrane protein OmpA-like peptidoglycan-associated protein
MKSLYVTAGLIAGMLLLAGCSGQKLYSAQKMTPGGSEFAQNLYHGYIGLSEDEYAEGDYTDSDEFADRAVASATDGAVQPEEIDARWLPSAHVDELTAARQKLVESLNAGAAKKDPAGAAQAQIMFDCWMQEQEENWQPTDIARCRDGYYEAFNKLTPEPPTPVATVAKPKPQTLRFVIYFDTDKYNLDESAQAVIAEARAAARKLGKPAVTIDGNTDTVGAVDYNQVLSENRAQVVAKVLGTGKLRAILTKANGETQPAILTADEIDEPRNRRVEIIIEQ